MLTLLACLAALSCRDALQPETAGVPTFTPPKVLATLECVADVTTRALTCEAARPQPGGARADLMLGQSQIKMASTNLVSDTLAEVFSFEATAQNLLTEPVGTPDRFTVTGLKVFFYSGPTVTEYKVAGDTSKVTVKNADGTGNFTGVNQPYHFYNQILKPQEVSAKKKWEFNVPRTVARFAFSVKILAAAPSETPVPMTIPRSWTLPARYFEDASVRSCEPVDAGRCVYDAVSVLFRGTATQAERQAAIDLIGGHVEGGSWSTNTYFVRIPADTTLATLQSALTSLRSLPQVRLAIPQRVEQMSPEYIRPTDDSNWRNWQLRDSSATGRKWSLEAISMPAAWGCETGTAGAPVAVVDTDFHGVADLLPNIEDRSVNGVHPDQLTAGADTSDHGTRVASIIAAVGNDSSGMTGVMWNARVRVYEVAFRTPGTPNIRRTNGHAVLAQSVVRDQIRLAAQQGASVINVSLGTDWNTRGAEFGYVAPGTAYNPATETNPTRRARNEARIREEFEFFRVMMDSILQLDQKNPLIILSAGNNGTDAYWNDWRIAADSFPNNVLVVGAARAASGGQLRPMQKSQGGITYATNYGSQVQISAPGQDVWMLNRDGQIERTGTSFAAPYVTAVAGLLLSFDPRLEQRADTLKQLLLQGAQNGGRRVAQYQGGGDIPFLHARETLKRAAERSGAPMCGNRVWHADSLIRVQRGEGNGSFVENVAPTGASLIDDLQIPHGGKRLFFFHPVTRRDTQFVWSAGSWAGGATISEATRDSVWEGLAPSVRSRWGSSHDNDAYVQIGVHNSGVELTLHRTGTSSQLLATLPEPYGVTGEYACTRLDSVYNAQTQRKEEVCKAQGLQGTDRITTTSPRVGYSPRGERVLLGVTTRTDSHTVDLNWYRCLDRHTEASDSSTYSSTELCRSTTLTPGTPTSKLYSVALPSGTYSVIDSKTGVRWEWVTFADGRDEFALQERVGAGSCTTEYRRTSAPTVAVLTVPGCGLGEATFSPARIGVGDAPPSPNRARSVPRTIVAGSARILRHALLTPRLGML